MKKYFLYTFLVALVITTVASGSTKKVGEAYFQTGDFDQNVYPLVVAPDAVSVVASANRNPIASNAVKAPYRTRSWLGGMLWGTGTTTNLWVGNDGNTAWTQPVFQQNDVYTETYFLGYNAAPQVNPSGQWVRGIGLCGMYPHFEELTGAYNGASGVANATWSTQPLALNARRIDDLLLVPSADTPTPNGGAMRPQWNSGYNDPDALLIDRMGDFCADIVYQDPTDTYAYTPFTTTTGTGSYIKFTVCQGSPFIWLESNKVPFLAFRNCIDDGSPGTANAIGAPVSRGATDAADVPGVDNVQYVLIYGNASNPNMTAVDVGLNPIGGQDNFNTWAIFWKKNTATFTKDTFTGSGQQNNYLGFTSTTGKTWVVIAKIPVQRYYPTTSTSAYNQDAAKAYAENLGKYAFNFLTDSAISYEVTKNSRLNTTFSVTLENPYNSSGMTTANATVLTLRPHHYKSMPLGHVPHSQSIVIPEVLDLNGSSLFPDASSCYEYWNVRGALKTILGTSFKTNYICNNLLHAAPPAKFDKTINSTTNTQYSSVNMGEWLFWLSEYDYLSNLTNTPWGGLNYFTVAQGVYNYGTELTAAAAQLNPIQQIMQEYGDTAATSQGWTEPRWIGSSGDTRWTTGRPYKSMNLALQNSVEGIQSAFNNFFNQTPKESSQKTTSLNVTLKHFVHYDTTAAMLTVHPISTDLAVGWGARNQLAQYLSFPIPSINEGFGVGCYYNDHHYNYGYFIAAAAIVAAYDGAWSPSTFNQSTAWSGPSKYGPAIDALVMDLAYDPTVTSFDSTYAQMNFAKMQFFDQWAGHGWADGAQGTMAGGGYGHNENSIGEANQAYSGIALWGIATQRRDVADLGIYLYTTATYSADSYFFDKNLFYKSDTYPSDFHPVTTNASGTYSGNKTFWDYTIPGVTGTSNASGLPKLLQSSLNYATDFTANPQAIMYISAFPVTSWTMAYGRFPHRMQYWLSSMDTTAFKDTISPTSSDIWNRSFEPNTLLMQALCGCTRSLTTGTSEPAPAGSPPTPLQYFVDRVTTTPSVAKTYYPPFKAGWLDGSTSISVGNLSVGQITQFLHNMEKGYGIPNWTLLGHGVTQSGSTSSEDSMVFTATFTREKEPGFQTTTMVAFNPGTSTVYVNFWHVEDTGETAPLLSTPLEVPPKRWAVSDEQHSVNEPTPYF